MTTITLTIPDAVTARVLNAFCRVYGYQSVFEDGSTNPQTKAQFVKQKIAGMIKDAVRKVEVEDAANAAATAAAQSADTDIVIS